MERLGRFDSVDAIADKLGVAVLPSMSTDGTNRYEHSSQLKEWIYGQIYFSPSLPFSPAIIYQKDLDKPNRFLLCLEDELNEV